MATSSSEPSMGVTQYSDMCQLVTKLMQDSVSEGEFTIALLENVQKRWNAREQANRRERESHKSQILSLQNEIKRTGGRSMINKSDPNPHMAERKTSDLDLESFKVKLRNELEINIRNEVALEFRREIDKIKEQFDQTLKDKNDQITELDGKVKALADKNQDLMSEKQRTSYEMTTQCEQLLKNIESKDVIITSMTKKNQELENVILNRDKALEENQRKMEEFKQKADEEIALLNRNIKVIQHLADDRSNLVESLRVDFRKKTDELNEKNMALAEENHKLKDDFRKCRCRSPGNGNVSNSENTENHLSRFIEDDDETKVKTEVKRATKVKKRPPVQEDINDYANMTFDGDDEIVQLSTKKTRKQITAGGKKRDLYQNLTLSGKKKKLRETEEEVELSPVSPPKRITRSRAGTTRRKLAY